jgi:ABC-type microcin C transport system permease subunit YejE
MVLSIPALDLCIYRGELMELGETKIDVIKITKQYKKRSQTAEVWKRLSRNKAALLGLATVIMLFLTVIFADVLYDYNDVVIKQNIPDRLQQPTWKHPFGTDELGRDILARIVHGGRMSLSISLVSVAFALLVGGILGAITGYFGHISSNPCDLISNNYCCCTWSQCCESRHCAGGFQRSYVFAYRPWFSPHG